MQIRMDNGSKKKPNSLISETSPYLLQHAYNPVEWQPWSEEAFEEARNSGKMVLVSIGYSACHWCHVMERESFENEEVAALMNAHFVNIKIDREERPDLDHIYMDAVQAMTGSGGWPLNVFLTPDKKPFYGGTYFPPEKAFNRPSWTDVLLGLVRAWKERSGEILEQAEQLTAHLSRSSILGLTSPGEDDKSNVASFSPEHCKQIFDALMKNADKVHGGFGRAPKFPQTFSIGYLIRYYHFSGNSEALRHALLSVDALLNGGIYDHVGGGMARYSTDDEWLAPHFEKMLYDNALLIQVLADAWQVTGNDKYRIAISHVVSFVSGEMTGPEGGFYSALDADSEGVEGKYYTWSREEIQLALQDMEDTVGSELFCAFFDISEQGNWEGTNILRKKESPAVFAAEKGIDPGRMEKIIAFGLERIARLRSGRTKPGLDDKVILSWNALMASALARAGAATGETGYLKLARTNLDFLFSRLGSRNESGAFLHTWKEGSAKYPAFLDDYACLAEACCCYYEATMEELFLLRARDICMQVLERFSDERDLYFYYTESGQTDVLFRKKEMNDGALPSANAVMAGILWKLGMIFGTSSWQKRAVAMLAGLSGLLLKYPSAFGYWAGLYLERAFGSVEIAVLGPNALEAAHQINKKYYLPGKCIQASVTGNHDYPLLAGKKDNRDLLIYVCRNNTCGNPVQTLAGLDGQLTKAKDVKQ